MNRIALAVPAAVVLVLLAGCTDTSDSTPSYRAATSTGQPGAPEAPACSGLTAQQAVDKWVDQVPTVYGWQWNTATVVTDGFDDCAALSWVVLPIEMPSNSSPYQIMLFHHGEFVGTATEKAYGFSPRVERRDDATIAVTYTYMKDGEATAFASGRTTATFTWDDAQNAVVMSGQTPDDVGGG